MARYRLTVSVMRCEGLKHTGLHALEVEVGGERRVTGWIDGEKNERAAIRRGLRDMPARGKRDMPARGKRDMPARGKRDMPAKRDEERRAQGPSRELKTVAADVGDAQSQRRMLACTERGLARKTKGRCAERVKRVGERAFAEEAAGCPQEREDADEETTGGRHEAAFNFAAVFSRVPRDGNVRLSVWHKRSWREDKRVCDTYYSISSLFLAPAHAFHGWLGLEHKTKFAGQVLVDFVLSRRSSTSKNGDAGGLLKTSTHIKAPEGLATPSETREETDSERGSPERRGEGETETLRDGGADALRGGRDTDARWRTDPGGRRRESGIEKREMTGESSGSPDLPLQQNSRGEDAPSPASSGDPHRTQPLRTRSPPSRRPASPRASFSFLPDSAPSAGACGLPSEGRRRRAKGEASQGEAQSPEREETGDAAPEKYATPCLLAAPSSSSSSLRSPASAPLDLLSLDIQVADAVQHPTLEEEIALCQADAADPRSPLPSSEAATVPAGACLLPHSKPQTPGPDSEAQAPAGGEAADRRDSERRAARAARLVDAGGDGNKRAFSEEDGGAGSHAARAVASLCKEETPTASRLPNPPSDTDGTEGRRDRAGRETNGDFKKSSNKGAPMQQSRLPDQVGPVMPLEAQPSEEVPARESHEAPLLSREGKPPPRERVREGEAGTGKREGAEAADGKGSKRPDGEGEGMAVRTSGDQPVSPAGDGCTPSSFFLQERNWKALDEIFFGQSSTREEAVQGASTAKPASTADKSLPVEPLEPAAASLRKFEWRGGANDEEATTDSTGDGSRGGWREHSSGQRTGGYDAWRDYQGGRDDPGRDGRRRRGSSLGARGRQTAAFAEGEGEGRRSRGVSASPGTAVQIEPFPDADFVDEGRSGGWREEERSSGGAWQGASFSRVQTDQRDGQLSFSSPQGTCHSFAEERHRRHVHGIQAAASAFHGRDVFTGLPPGPRKPQRGFHARPTPDASFQSRGRGNSTPQSNAVFPSDAPSPFPGHPDEAAPAKHAQPCPRPSPQVRLSPPSTPLPSASLSPCPPAFADAGDWAPGDPAPGGRWVQGQGCEDACPTRGEGEGARAASRTPTGESAATAEDLRRLYEEGERKCFYREALVDYRRWNEAAVEAGHGASMHSAWGGVRAWAGPPAQAFPVTVAAAPACSSPAQSEPPVSGPSPSASPSAASSSSFSSSSSSAKLSWFFPRFKKEPPTDKSPRGQEEPQTTGRHKDAREGPGGERHSAAGAFAGEGTAQAAEGGGRRLSSPPRFPAPASSFENATVLAAPVSPRASEAPSTQKKPSGRLRRRLAGWHQLGKIRGHGAETAKNERQRERQGGTSVQGAKDELARPPSSSAASCQELGSPPASPLGREASHGADQGGEGVHHEERGRSLPPSFPALHPSSPSSSSSQHRVLCFSEGLPGPPPDVGASFCRLPETPQSRASGASLSVLPPSPCSPASSSSVSASPPFPSSAASSPAPAAFLPPPPMDEASNPRVSTEDGLHVLPLLAAPFPSFSSSLLSPSLPPSNPSAAERGDGRPGASRAAMPFRAAMLRAEDRQAETAGFFHLISEPYSPEARRAVSSLLGYLDGATTRARACSLAEEATEEDGERRRGNAEDEKFEGLSAKKKRQSSKREKLMKGSSSSLAAKRPLQAAGTEDDEAEDFFHGLPSRYRGDAGILSLSSSPSSSPGRTRRKSLRRSRSPSPSPSYAPLSPLSSSLARQSHEEMYAHGQDVSLKPARKKSGERKERQSPSRRPRGASLTEGLRWKNEAEETRKEEAPCRKPESTAGRPARKSAKRREESVQNGLRAETSSSRGLVEPSTGGIRGTGGAERGAMAAFERQPQVDATGLCNFSATNGGGNTAYEALGAQQHSYFRSFLVPSCSHAAGSHGLALPVYPPGPSTGVSPPGQVPALLPPWRSPGLSGLPPSSAPRQFLSSSPATTYGRPFGAAPSTSSPPRPEVFAGAHAPTALVRPVVAVPGAPPTASLVSSFPLPPQASSLGPSTRVACAPAALLASQGRCVEAQAALRLPQAASAGRDAAFSSSVCSSAASYFSPVSASAAQAFRSSAASSPLQGRRGAPSSVSLGGNQPTRSPVHATGDVPSGSEAAHSPSDIWNAGRATLTATGVPVSLRVSSSSPFASASSLQPQAAAAHHGQGGGKRLACVHDDSNNPFALFSGPWRGSSASPPTQVLPRASPLSAASAHGLSGSSLSAAGLPASLGSTASASFASPSSRAGSRPGVSHPGAFASASEGGARVPGGRRSPVSASRKSPVLVVSGVSGDFERNPFALLGRAPRKEDSESSPQPPSLSSASASPASCMSSASEPVLGASTWSDRPCGASASPFSWPVRGSTDLAGRPSLVSPPSPARGEEIAGASVSSPSASLAPVAAPVSDAQQAQERRKEEPAASGADSVSNGAPQRMQERMRREKGGMRGRCGVKTEEGAADCRERGRERVRKLSGDSVVGEEGRHGVATQGVILAPRFPSPTPH
ncbi:hypothetical protein BESB_067880 [Besnoitia besnoiti]|uniref:Uncharacterized protein n=1 Tax=Besnoitia besnoiti TaxID=94643 RepID=A0A2A9M9T5_BESBE|nr:hypothetical protein BESB_067880 [Besnoitia besnoiti]PFH34755.1 hypothetical protein BESB_067880 [Besnoitia besnoiti]